MRTTASGISGFAHVLRLSFADIDFLNPDLSNRARGKLVHLFAVEHSNAIRSVVEGLPGDITSVVIHCEGGFSRSCAVAVALHRLYGYQTGLQHPSTANPSIVCMMTGNACGYGETRKTPPLMPR